MTQHVIRSFAEELELLAGDVARMGGLTEHQTASALHAVVRRDEGAARLAIERDAQVDALEKRIEERVLLLLALRQPLARDLRVAVGSLKIAAHLERVGDLAKNIAKRSLVLSTFAPLPITHAIETMGLVVLEQLKDVLDAYVQNDVERALRVWRRDATVDQHHESLFRDLLTVMGEGASQIAPGAHLMFIAKNMERIGDYATNIAEEVQFLVTGEPAPGCRPKVETAALEDLPRAAGDERRPV